MHILIRTEYVLQITIQKHIYTVQYTYGMTVNDSWNDLRMMGYLYTNWLFIVYGLWMFLWRWNVRMINDGMHKFELSVSVIKSTHMFFFFCLIYSHTYLRKKEEKKKTHTNIN